MLVATAKETLRKTPMPDRTIVAQKILVAFSDIFQYLSTRTAEIQTPLLTRLENEDFIPSTVNGEVAWFRPNVVFFKSEEDTGDSVTESLFHVVDCSPFLAATGVKQEASTKDVFLLIIGKEYQCNSKVLCLLFLIFPFIIIFILILIG